MGVSTVALGGTVQFFIAGLDCQCTKIKKESYCLDLTPLQCKVLP